MMVALSSRRQRPVCEPPKELCRCHHRRTRSLEMPDIAGYDRYPGMERHFDERKIAGIRDRAGDRRGRDEHAFPFDKRENLPYRIFREREFLSPQHVRVLVENPRVEHEDQVAVDDKIEDAGRSPPA